VLYHLKNIMKTINNTILFSILIVFISCGTSKKIVEPSANSRAVDELVANEQFLFEAEWARPLATNAMNSVMQSGVMLPGNSATQINIMGSGYFFKMEGDSVSANLPYYGERQMGGGYGSNSGIVFKGTPKNLKVVKDNSKQKYDITFNISEEVESYRCRLELFPNKSGSLLISSSQRFTIRYDGKVAALETEDL